MIMQRLTKTGIARMTAFLDSLTTESPLPYPSDLLESGECAEPFPQLTEIEDRSFRTRLEIAEYLYPKLEGADQAALQRDPGIWSWLALFYFRQLCEKGHGGKYKPGALPRWVLAADSYTRYYRHLIAGPYQIYRAHRADPKRAAALLCNPPGKMGDVVEQIASRQDLVTNPAVVEAATALYVDPVSGRYKRGAGSKLAGSPRRYAAVLDQLDLTYDLRSMSGERLLTLLPTEFERFRKLPA